MPLEQAVHGLECPGPPQLADRGRKLLIFMYLLRFCQSRVRECRLHQQARLGDRLSPELYANGSDRVTWSADSAPPGLGTDVRVPDLRGDAARPRPGQYRPAGDVARGRGRRALGDRAAGGDRRGSGAGQRRRARPVSAPATCCWPSATGRSSSPRRSWPSCTRSRPARAFATRCCACSRPRSSASRWRRCHRAPPRSTSCSPRSASSRCWSAPAFGYRRHSDEATLHFFWLCLAFFGAITFSFNGRLDRLDWFFYWTDVVSILLLPPLFLHFTLVFPERPRSWVRTPMGRTFLPLLYLPAALLGLARVIAISRSPLDAKYFIGVVAALDRFEPLYLSICLAAGLVIAHSRVRARAFGDRAAPAALDRLGHGAWRAALRAGLRGAVRVWRRPVAADGVVGDSAQLRAARLCLGHRPLPADGRRGDPQAHARVGRRHRGHPGPLRGAAQRRHRRLQRQRRQSQLGHRAAGHGGGRAAGRAR